MNDLRLSIVIPVYNLENYISETLDACLGQNIPANEYEIICIDDGSKDGSLDILRSYAERHRNIIVRTKENGGVSSARNIGLSLAKGTYIWFVDGDDLIAKNTLATVLSYAEATNIDALKFGMQHTKSRQTFPAEFHTFELCECATEIPNFMTSTGGTGGGVCSQWFRRKLLLENNITFAEHIHYSEDVLFSFQVMLHSKRCAKTTGVFYYYYQRPGSAMHGGNPLKHAESMYLLAQEYDKMAKNYSDSFFSDIIKTKRSFALKAMLFSLIQTGEISLVKRNLSKITKEGLYPYPFLKKSLQNNQTWKQVVINYASFLFPCRWYVILCVCLIALKKKFKR